MQLDKLKVHFDSGDLTSATIVPAPMEPGPKPCWNVQFRRKNGVIIIMDLDKRRNGRPMQRVFRSLDAAFNACQEVGFREAKVSGNKS